MPLPGVQSTSTTPPIRSMLERTTSMPTPRPEMAVTCLGGRQAGLEDQRELLARGVSFGRFGLSITPAAIAFSTSFLPSMPRPSSAISIRIWLPDWRAETRQQADLALAGLQALGRRLDAVIDRVADDVGQRIADHLDHLAVELDVAAVDIDQHLLAKLGGQVADHARQSDEQIFDPLHAGAGDGVAHFGDDRRQPLERAVDGDVARRFAQPAGELVAGQHHVGHAAHHPVEQFDRQADGARRRRPCVCASATAAATGCDAGPSAPRCKRVDQRAVVAAGQLFAGVDAPRPSRRSGR